MPKLYDEDGKEIIEVETIEGLEDRLKEDEEGKKKSEELEAQNSELKTKVASLENKDFNFRAFAKSSEEEKTVLMEKMTEMEKASVLEITRLTAEISEGTKQAHNFLKEKAVKALSGGDDELEKELEKAYEKSLQFGGEPKTKDDVIARMSDAYRYVKGVTPSVNALNSFTPNTPVFEDKKEKRFTDTEKGKDMLHSINPELYPKKVEEKKD